MISAVLDANTIASGILGFRNPGSIPGALLHLWQKDIFILITSKHIRDEVKDLLQKPYFKRHLSLQEISRIQALLQFHVKQVIIKEEVHAATHPEDDLILATAISAKADFLVTGDGPFLRKVGHSFKEVTLVTPNEFLQILMREDII